jgi:hypothetical protein
VSAHERPLANHEIVTLAVFLLGGTARPVDMEDVAIKANENEIAPGRFAWRKYKNQINLDAVRRRLWDAKLPKLGYRFLRGSEGEGWLLTESGAEFCRLAAPKLASKPSTTAPSNRNEQRWISAERTRLCSSAAFEAFQAGKLESLTRRDTSSFFRLDEYVTGEARDRKIDRILNAFKDDAELGSLVSLLAQRLRGDRCDES